MNLIVITNPNLQYIHKKVKRKAPTYHTQENHQTTREETRTRRKEQRRTMKTTRKQSTNWK